MATEESSPMTIGMHLDAFVERLDSLSSTQLYGIIVVATVGVSFFLLGSGGGLLEDTTTIVPIRKTRSSSLELKGKQPRWHILKWLNYAACVGFVASVANFAMQVYGGESSVSLLQYLVGWSVFLCYFFGFFGISFIDAEELAMASSTRSDEHNATTTGSLTSSGSNAALKKTPVPVHPPARATPLCSDPKSFVAKAATGVDLVDLPDEEIASLVLEGKLKDHELEKRLDPHRAVSVRRVAFNSKLESLNHKGALEALPYEPSLDYSRVHGANCEIVVGYIPLPVGMVGPLTLNGETIYVPMATTEGCLVASTNRGAKAISQGSGAHAIVVKDGITRAPCVRMQSARDAAALKLWCEIPSNFITLKQAFESTTSFGKLQSCQPTIAGRNVYIRLVCFAGDAMGMNMVSKGSLAVIELLQQEFPTLELVALSGNMCTDKKAAATNWIQGRGKSVVVEATIPKQVVRSTLKTSVKAICSTNLQKNLVGSAMAGTVGGFNAHASNIVTAVFLATGQDPAQNVESSNCITLLEETEEGDLWISCTMPSIEVGTVGGGTSLPAQSACLKAIGVQGGSSADGCPGDNARKLAQVVAAATMAGELSLLAALAANTLVQAHMTHNRKNPQSK